MEENRAKKALQEVMRMLNTLPCHSGDFLGENLYMEVQGVLDGTTYAGCCDDCGEFFEGDKCPCAEEKE